MQSNSGPQTNSSSRHNYAADQRQADREMQAARNRLRELILSLLPLVSDDKVWAAFVELLAQELTSVNRQLHAAPRRLETGGIDLEEHWMLMGEIRALNRLAETRDKIRAKQAEL